MEVDGNAGADQAMNWLRITHETVYRYRAAMKFAPHRLLLRPREGHDVRVEEMKIEISPAFELEWSRDVFGNSVATAHLLAGAEELRIRSRVVLRQTNPFPSPAPRSTLAVPFPVQFQSLEETVAAAYRKTTFPDDVAAVRSWISENIDLSSLPDAASVVACVGHTIRKTIAYLRREETGVQTPAMTIESRSGSCRDLSTLMLEALRVLGFPARFASGYLDCTASLAGRAATHAWAEAYLPQMGWLGYDPTLGEMTSSKHVVVGVSNHPRGVMPITGSFYGEAEDYLGMEVSVQTGRLSEWPASMAIL